MPQGLEGILDVLGMFIVRVGVPVAITFGIGMWVERKFQLSEQLEQKARIAQAALTRHSKIIPMQCWVIKNCDRQAVADCPAFKHPDLPCWLATQVAKDQVRAECLSCRLYRPRRQAA